MSTISGIDVSNNNGTINWSRVPASVRFVYAKASEGTSFVDNQFQANARACKASRRYFGAYHYLDPLADPVAQARHFHAVAGDTTGQLPPVVDVESLAKNESYTQRRTSLNAFLAEADRLFGRPLGIYTGEDFYAHLHPAVSGRMIWLAKYSTRPLAFPHDIWQDSGQGTVQGIGSGVDLDVYTGGETGLLKLAGRSWLVAHLLHLLHVARIRPLTPHENHELVVGSG